MISRVKPAATFGPEVRPRHALGCAVIRIDRYTVLPLLQEQMLRGVVGDSWGRTLPVRDCVPPESLPMDAAFLMRWFWPRDPHVALGGKNILEGFGGMPFSEA